MKYLILLLLSGCTQEASNTKLIHVMLLGGYGSAHLYCESVTPDYCGMTLKNCGSLKTVQCAVNVVIEEGK